MREERLTDPELIDAIYEAAIRADLWPGLLDRIASFSETIAGCLFVAYPWQNPQTEQQSIESRWVTSPWFRERVEAFIRDGWAAKNLRAERLLAADHHGFLTDRDICSEGEIATHPHYEYLRAKGGTGNGAATAIKVPSGETLIFSWDKRYHEGPVSLAMLGRLNALRPHLARAALFSARLGLERARAAAEALSMIGLPAAVLDKSFHILAANERLQKLIPTVLGERAGGRIKFVNERADRLLSDAVASLVYPDHTLSTLSIPVPSTEDTGPIVAHVVPLRNTARDIFSQASCVLVLTPVAASSAPAEHVIRGLFDLTPTEANVARSIVAGHTIEDISAKKGVSEGTVRIQLKSVFSKVGVSRQAELVSVLSSASLSRHGGNPTG